MFCWRAAPHITSGCPRSGPLKPEVILCRREILVRQYTPAAWRSQIAWHVYWEPHGYDTLDEELRAGSPPTPSSRHRIVKVPWAQARAWVTETALASAPAAASDASRTRPRVSQAYATTCRADPGGDLAATRRRALARAGCGRGLVTSSIVLLLGCASGSQPGPPGARSASRPGGGVTSAPEGCEASIRELLADIARGSTGARRLEQRAHAALERAAELLAFDGDVSPVDADRGGSSARTCEWCTGPLPPGLRPEARYCKKSCRQKASRARLKDQPSRSPSPPPAICGWCEDPMPAGLRPEARYCGKRCRQAASRFALAVKRATARTTVPGPSDTSPASATPARATRRRSPRREVLDDASRAMRFAYADPPYPGKAHYYPEREDVDHQALVERLVGEFGDGWALSTSAAGLQDVLALCPPGVRVCSWHRAVRPTRSRRAISAWEPLIVCGGRELPTDRPQTVRDALAYGGRYRTFPGAMTGMKPPQFAVWMFAQLGARPAISWLTSTQARARSGRPGDATPARPPAAGSALGASATASRARRASLPPAIPTPPTSGSRAASSRCAAAAAVACTAPTTRAAPCAS